jgi:1,4-alpha-glucan branching enzyme
MRPSYPEKNKGKGSLLMMLHAHLPYIRYPEHENFLEENWLYEIMTESYIPLIDTFEKLLDDNVDFRVAISLSPPLVEMLRDDLLMSRYMRYLLRLIDLSEREIYRNRKSIRFRDLGVMYLRRFQKAHHIFESVYKRDLISAFKGLSESGKIEIITSSSTHGYLPALMPEPAAVKVQIQLAAERYREIFGKNPPGIWLPECGFKPEMEAMLKDSGIRYFFLEPHPVSNRFPGEDREVFTSFKTPSGLTVFGRDAVSCREVWSARDGYPGDAHYRDFYRDIGYDLDEDYIRPYLPGGIRTFTGIKYFRVTGSSVRKKPYNRVKALRKAESDARHFLKNREAQICSLNRKEKISPVITVAFDAELFGHWWFEGPEWLNHLFRKTPREANSLRFVTPTEYITENPATEILNPCLSSWGVAGYSATWVHPSNSWIYKHLHRAAKRMKEISIKNLEAEGITRRALNQAARELLLAQSSDWAFMIQKERASEFGTRKITEHIRNFLELYHEITSGKIDSAHLVLLEEKNNIFSGIDFRIYAC